MPVKIYKSANKTAFEVYNSGVLVYKRVYDSLDYTFTRGKYVLTKNVEPIENGLNLTVSDFLDSSDTPYTSDAALQADLDDVTGKSGVGSGQGFIDYNDTTGSVSLTENTWTTIPNNGEGSFTNKAYKPEGVTEFMDVSTGAIDASEVDLGDTIVVRNDFTVNPNTNNALLKFRYSLGTGGSAYTLETTIARLDNGSGVDYRFSLKPDLIYMGDSNTKDNPISLQVKLSAAGTLINSGSVIQLLKGIQ